MPWRHIWFNMPCTAKATRTWKQTGICTRAKQRNGNPSTMLQPWSCFVVTSRQMDSVSSLRAHPCWCHLQACKFKQEDFEKWNAGFLLICCLISPVLMLTVVKMMSLAWIDCNSWLHVTPDFIDEGQGSGAQWKDRRAGGNVAYRDLESKGQEVHSLGFWGLRLVCVSTLPQLPFLACAASWGR